MCAPRNPCNTLIKTEFPEFPVPIALYMYNRPIVEAVRRLGQYTNKHNYKSLVKFPERQSLANEFSDFPEQ